jgi:WbqC-like protein
MTLVSSFLSFPNIGWWTQVMNADEVIFDGAEHFQKMSYRNRYRISGANNSVLLSIPLVNGRDQRTPAKDVRIFNGASWQKQHWRTLVSVYSRTPYFEHYAESLKPLFDAEYDLLIDFNRASITWVARHLKFKFQTSETAIYTKEYPPGVIDLRNFKEKTGAGEFRKYYQVFEDRLGFIPNLSILDLLFSEGPGTVQMLKG